MIDGVAVLTALVVTFAFAARVSVGATRHEERETEADEAMHRMEWSDGRHPASIHGIGCAAKNS